MSTEELREQGYYAETNIFHHVGEDVVNRAVRYSKEIGAYVKHLDKFGVCGIIGIPMFHKILNYLKAEKDRGFLEPQISFYERKGLIWMAETIGEPLDRQFAGLPKPSKQKQIGNTAHYKDGTTARTTPR